MIKTAQALYTVSAGILLLGAVACTTTKPGLPFAFDEKPRSATADGWIAGSTNPSPKAGEWVIDRGILSLTGVESAERPTFHVLWRDDVAFKDGTIRVRVMANTGVIDQGGGLIWRVKDADNYYIARYNPLESNLRVYYVKDGKRVMLGDAPGIDVPAKEWFLLAVHHHGDQILVRIDTEVAHILEATDSTFPDAGGVGFWAKADAATSFDDLRIEAE